MSGSDVFDLYRQSLTLVVGVYVVFRTANFVIQWQAAIASARKPEAILRRYLAVQFLRVRVRRFAFDLLQVAVLVAVLGYLVWLHGERALAVR